MNLMQASIIWHSQKRKISELKPAPYNPRELTEKQAQDLATSLELFNLAEPIVINQNNTIVGGHQRINILKAKYGDNGTEVVLRFLARTAQVANTVILAILAVSVFMSCCLSLTP